MNIIPQMSMVLRLESSCVNLTVIVNDIVLVVAMLSIIVDFMILLGIY